MSDPLVNLPHVRKWSDLFFEKKGWQPVAMPVGGPMEGRRTAALAALGKLVIGPDLQREARRAFDGGVKSIRADIAKALVADDFDKVDAAIVSLGKDIATQDLITKARAAALAKVLQAEERFAAIKTQLDEGSLIFVERKAKAARAAFDAAASVDTFTAAGGLADAAIAAAAEAQSFGTDFGQWNAAAVVFCDMQYVGDDEKVAAHEARTNARDAAVAFTVLGNFAQARTALDAFPGDALKDMFAKAVAFAKVLADFEANDAAMCATVTASGLKGASGKAEIAKTARKKGFIDKRYDETAKALKDLVTWCGDRRVLAEEYAKYDSAMKSSKAYRDAVEKMDKAQETGKIDEALQHLRDLDDDDELQDKNRSLVIDKRLAATYAALVARVAEPVKTTLSDLWKAHKKALTENKPDEAKAAADKIKRYLELPYLLDRQAEAKEAMKDHPGAAAYKYLEAFREAGNAGRFLKARQEIDKMLPLVRLLVEYLDLKAEAETLRAAVPADPPDLRLTLDTALAEAEIKAKAKDPKGAADQVRATLSSVDFFALAAAIADWKAKLAAVRKRQALVARLLGGPALMAAIDNSIEEARVAAETSFAYADAFLALTRVEAALAEAQEMAAARRQATAVRDAVIKAGTGDAGTIDPEIAKAEKLATEGKFKEAGQAFDAALKFCEAMCEAAALKFESEDGKDSNAGHSIDRHGPKVSKEALIKRLQTGTPPNNKTADETAFTGASSKFKSPQDWLAGRDLSAKAALAKGINVDAKEIKLPYAGKSGAIDFVVEHGRDIDEAFVGLKKNTKTGTEGPIDDRTYESYEELTGLTRSYVNWIFEFDKIDNVPKDPKDPAGPKETVTPKSVEDYVKAYKSANADVEPATIPGHWVMMQQFPLAEGWDNALKVYKNTPEGLIP